MVVSTFATMEAGSAFFRSTMANNIVLKRGIKLTHTYIHSYEDYGFVAFGAAGSNFIRVITVGWFIGLCSGYVILMGQNVQNILWPIIELNYRVWVLILFPLLWLLSMMRDLSAIAKLMPVGVAAAMGSCILIIVKGIIDIRIWQSDDFLSPEANATASTIAEMQLHYTWPSGDFLSLGSLTATVFGAVACMGNVPSVLDEMKNKHKFRRSFRTALLIVMVLYIGIMLIAYHAYGNFILPNIVDSMKFHPTTWEESQTVEPKDWTGAQSVLLPTAMSCCVVINLIISYPLNLAPVFIAFQGTEYGKQNMKVGSKMNYIMRTCIVTLTVAIPLAVSDFSLVFNLFASICGPVQGVLAPIWFGFQIRKKVHAQNSGFARLSWHGFLSAIGFFCIAFGLTDSVRALIASFTE